ncbi:MAG: 3-deoxy-manno-octulosonate cytidylyltransferase [Phycisphaerales bacterium]
MHAVAIIPARFASSRFPGKMLADRTGKPLVQHVWERVRLARRVDRVIVATDDARIADAVRTFGGEATMTRADHPNGTTRIAEVAASLDSELVVNVQGDEPEIDPALIDRVVELLDDRPDCPMATLAAPCMDATDFANPNIVKVVLRRDGTALCFSRAPIPFDRDRAGEVAPLRHIGIYGYRRDFLPRYVAMPETPLERCERLEQLRALEHGVPIAVAIVDATVHGIDTPEQYDRFVDRCAAAAAAAAPGKDLGSGSGQPR